LKTIGQKNEFLAIFNSQNIWNLETKQKVLRKWILNNCKFIKMHYFYLRHLKTCFCSKKLWKYRIDPDDGEKANNFFSILTHILLLLRNISKCWFQRMGLYVVRCHIYTIDILWAQDKDYYILTGCQLAKSGNFGRVIDTLWRHPKPHTQWKFDS